MSREIKFRAWDRVNGGQMMYGSSISGCALQELNNDTGLVFMQYTGTKDTSLNRAEIYEGDLFGVLGGDASRPNQYEVTGEVYYDSDFASFCVKYPNGGWSFLHEHMMGRGNHTEVIGNIYEDEYLLGGDEKAEAPDA